ncbi:leucine rich repeat containing 51 isoform X2 [Conger conger]|uniref:leucine rich repeat containing 51 isoform X2 n=1 Tax=Conger conger TaxID=82655 RepID=UPI002A5A5A2C|nr:leucine rich repeat containing 51 isoform X2 [Conger conger]
MNSNVKQNDEIIYSMNEALTEEHRQGLRPLERNEEQKFCTQALRLNNNKIKDLTGFSDAITTLLSEPFQLAWVDLSYNLIPRIDPVLTELPELRVLYLHGNKIAKLSEVDKLGVLPCLHTLTLHGNAVENEKGYRGYLIKMLPHLKSIDFCTVTKEETVMAKIWHRTTARSKATQRSQQ